MKILLTVRKSLSHSPVTFAVRVISAGASLTELSDQQFLYVYPQVHFGLDRFGYQPLLFQNAHQRPTLEPIVAKADQAVIAVPLEKSQEVTDQARVTLF